MPGARSVALGFWGQTGPRDKQPRSSGSSHFLEHLLFKGTKTRSARDIAEAFDAVGGDVNALPEKEYTCFSSRVLDRDLPMAVKFLADMVQDSVIKAADLDAERQVILEEINMHEDTPDDLIHDLFNETLWPDHPLGRPVLGTVQSIEAASRRTITSFYRKHYVPGNLVVVATGNVQHDRLLEDLDGWMQTGRGRAGGPSTWKLRPGGDGPEPSGRRLVKRRKTEQAHIVIGTNGFSRSDPDRFALGVVNAGLGGGLSSRLFQEVREKRGLAYSVYSYTTMFAEAGVCAVYAGTTPARADEVLSLIRGELGSLATEGLTHEEFSRAKSHMKGSLVLSLEDPGGRMSRLGKSEISHGEVLTMDQILKRLDAVTLEDTRRAAARVFNQPLALTVLGPFGARAFSSGGAPLAGSHGGRG